MTLAIGAPIPLSSLNNVVQNFSRVFAYWYFCPENVVIKALFTSSGQNVNRVPLSNILVDDFRCFGVGTEYMMLFPREMARSRDELLRLGFRLASDALISNPIGNRTLHDNNFPSSFVVGFDEGRRVCGRSAFEADSMWMLIRESNRFDITVRKELEDLTIRFHRMRVYCGFL